MIACNESAYYKQSIEITEGSWAFENPVNFEIDIDDIESYFDLILDVDHSPEYSYENLYVNIHTTFPSGEKVTDLVSLQLTDNLDQWEGKCNANQCTVSILLQNRVYFKEKGKHTISIEQYNRENPIEGVMALTMKMLAID